jgi:uncharacterized membrane protein YfcA
MGAFLGTAVATYKYAIGGHVPWRYSIAALLGALPLSFLGAQLLLILPQQYVKIGVLAALPIIAVVVLLNKDSMQPHQRVPQALSLPACFAIGLLMGIYDGLIGPGTGTFLQLMFVGLIGMETLKASGAARLVNLCTNIGALAYFTKEGQVLYALALPAAIFGMAGNFLGSTLAIRRGAPFIRVLLICVLVLLIGALAWDVLISHRL